MKLEIRLLSIIIRLLFQIAIAVGINYNNGNLTALRKEANYWLDDDKLGENL